MTLTLRSELLTRHGVRHGFSLRTGGVSAAPFTSLNLARNVGDDPASVAENHERLARAVGYLPECLVEVSQVHSASVELVDGSVPPLELRTREADALVCVAPDLAIGVRVADCVPILLAHPASGVVAAVHAGWRGAVAGVIGRAVLRLCESARAKPAELVAAVGPHIGPASFEVGEEVAELLQACAPELHGVVLTGSPRPTVDLSRIVRAQLEACGLSPHNLDRVPGCTYRDPARFYSFRRDGNASGRHLAVIVSGC